jgi:hypothetical protein
MADAVNLCAEGEIFPAYEGPDRFSVAHQMASFSTLPPQLLSQAHAVLSRLDKWQPDLTVFDAPPAQRLPIELAPEVCCEQELHRQTAMLQIQRLVLRKSTFDPVMRAIVVRCLNLIRALMPLMCKRRRKSRTLVDHWSLFTCQPVVRSSGLFCPI